METSAPFWLSIELISDPVGATVVVMGDCLTGCPEAFCLRRKPTFTTPPESFGDSILITLVEGGSDSGSETAKFELLTTFITADTAFELILLITISEATREVSFDVIIGGIIFYVFLSAVRAGRVEQFSRCLSVQSKIFYIWQQLPSIHRSGEPRLM